MTTFEEFWKEYEESSDLLSLEGVARWAWEEAVLAERERCIVVCGVNTASYNKWCKDNEAERFWDSAEDTAYAAWKAATLAERERCAKVCRDLHSHYGVHDYHGLLLEASRAIRSP